MSTIYNLTSILSDADHEGNITIAKSKCAETRIETPSTDSFPMYYNGVSVGRVSQVFINTKEYKSIRYYAVDYHGKQLRGYTHAEIYYEYTDICLFVDCVMDEWEDYSRKYNLYEVDGGENKVYDYDNTRYVIIYDIEKFITLLESLLCENFEEAIEKFNV
jgi:hypothetical protein